MKKLASLLLLLLFPLIMIAQGPPPPPPPPPGLPIDGGLLFLLIAGIVYGVKKLKN
ncbi:hypothetical protein OAD34_04405 [Flavobacteriaceae bacterium]|jgi:hypothetical protein|nr:hypothetical protein [Flavobacteriaceae bacterium]MDC1342059.1 hypothetical protein [Flavobacteriaceae bacterium]|tara:strand:- start:580 stop:747 length:168 start_codon:yes stop_codon:yes gene_type:complete